MKLLTLFSFCLVALLLTSCGEDQVTSLGPQQWNDLQFVVEARPTPIRAGMNEFIVIASRGNVNPGYDLIVSLRVDNKTEWKQAIQDGYTGVYRRAIKVGNPATDILAVQVRKSKNDDEENSAQTVLYFPLAKENN